MASSKRTGLGAPARPQRSRGGNDAGLENSLMVFYGSEKAVM